MLIIKTPIDNLKERKYIIHIIFNELLDIKYCHKTCDSNSEIILENNHKLIIEDHFFSKNKNDLDYLTPDSLPAKIEYTSNDFIIGRDIPIIFGNSSFNITDSSSITCGIDVFASIFFMISRWEEFVNPSRDVHDRFSATKSISYKNGFLNRPIVDEYVEMLWNMLMHLGCVQHRNIKNSQLYLTHDIDKLYLWKNWKQVFRVAIGDLLKRKSFRLANERLFEYYLIKNNKMNDSFDTFDWLMDQSEVIGVKSRFYFMSGGVTKYDNWYKIDSRNPIALDNIALIQNFLGGVDEEWFTMIHIVMEAQAGPAMLATYNALNAAKANEWSAVNNCLYTIANSLENVYNTFCRMQEKCDPYIYYNRVRPYIFGTLNNPDLPDGLIYEGVEEFEGKPQQFRGETGAQSSIIPALDGALGIVHEKDMLREYLMEMRDYMPPKHRAFIEWCDANGNLSITLVFPVSF